MPIDLHTHSSVSDGTETPAELLATARSVGLDVIALTGSFAAAARELGIRRSSTSWPACAPSGCTAAS